MAGWTPPRRLSAFTFVITALLGAIDTGAYGEISVESVQSHLQSGDLFPWLESTIDGLDLGLVAVSRKARQEFTEALAEVRGRWVTLLGSATAADANLRDKYSGVENSRLCYLAALTADVLAEKIEHGS